MIYLERFQLPEAVDLANLQWREMVRLNRRDSFGIGIGSFQHLEGGLDNSRLRLTFVLVRQNGHSCALQ